MADEHTWSFYLVNILAIFLNLAIVFTLMNRVWATRKLEGRIPVISRTAKGILALAAIYQIVLSTTRLFDYTLPDQFRDTWIMKDVGIFLYVISISYLNRLMASSKPVSVAESKRLAQERTMREAIRVGTVNHDERLRNGPESEAGSEEPR